MKFLLDHCVPRPLLKYLDEFEIIRAGQMGWAELVNGKLLAAAEAENFAALITVDKGFATQQNMADRKISVLLLDSRDTDLDGLLPLIPALRKAMMNIKPGTLIRVKAD